MGTFRPADPHRCQLLRKGHSFNALFLEKEFRFGSALQRNAYKEVICCHTAYMAGKNHRFI